MAQLVRGDPVAQLVRDDPAAQIVRDDCSVAVSLHHYHVIDCVLRMCSF